jgi:hypothetical protein
MDEVKKEFVILSNEGPSGIVALLDSERAAGLSPVKVRDVGDNNRSLSDHPYMKNPKRSGYIHPDNVIGYFQEHTNLILGPLQLRVWIGFREEWNNVMYEGRAGSYEFSPTSRFNHDEDVVYGGILPQDVLEKRIDPQYIAEDCSGVIIPITPEVVEKRIQEQIDRIDSGKTISADFDHAEKLAKAGGLDFSERLRQAKAYTHDKYVDWYSNPKRLEETLSSLEGSAEFFVVRTSVDEDYGHMPDGYSDFLEIIEEIIFPDPSLKERVLRLLDTYSQGHYQAATQIQTELEKMVRERTEEAQGFKSEGQRLALLKRKLEGDPILANVSL